MTKGINTDSKIANTICVAKKYLHGYADWGWVKLKGEKKSVNSFGRRLFTIDKNLSAKFLFTIAFAYFCNSRNYVADSRRLHHSYACIVNLYFLCVGACIRNAEHAGPEDLRLLLIISALFNAIVTDDNKANSRLYNPHA